jgi:hypothetical protein
VSCLVRPYWRCVMSLQIASRPGQLEVKCYSLGVVLSRQKLCV